MKYLIVIFATLTCFGSYPQSVLTGFTEKLDSIYHHNGSSTNPGFFSSLKYDQMGRVIWFSTHIGSSSNAAKAEETWYYYSNSGEVDSIVSLMYSSSVKKRVIRYYYNGVQLDSSYQVVFASGSSLDSASTAYKYAYYPGAQLHVRTKYSRWMGTLDLLPKERLSRSYDAYNRVLSDSVFEWYQPGTMSLQKLILYSYDITTGLISEQLTKTSAGTNAALKTYQYSALNNSVREESFWWDDDPHFGGYAFIPLTASEYAYDSMMNMTMFKTFGFNSVIMQWYHSTTTEITYDNVLVSTTAMPKSGPEPLAPESPYFVTNRPLHVKHPNNGHTWYYYSGGINVPKQEKKSGISLFPNPTRDKIWINIPQHENPLFNIIVMDMQGKEWHSKQIYMEGENIPVDISGLPPGIYLLQLENSTGTVWRQKVLKVQ